MLLSDKTTLVLCDEILVFQSLKGISFKMVSDNTILKI